MRWARSYSTHLSPLSWGKQNVPRVRDAILDPCFSQACLGREDVHAPGADVEAHGAMDGAVHAVVAGQPLKVHLPQGLAGPGREAF